jgi:hypothetical protein
MMSAAAAIIGIVSTDPDQPPGRPFDGFAELRWAITELHHLAVKLGITLGADDEAAQAATWDAGSWSALDLYERTLIDLGTLSARCVRNVIRNRQP